MVTRLLAGKSKNGWFISGGGKKFFLSSRDSDRLLEPQGRLSNEERRTFPGVKGPYGESDHSPPSCNKIKNEWIYKSTPHMSL